MNARSVRGPLYRPQIKICGLTQVDQALGCAELGIDAIGCVFFPKSPRFVSDEQAGEICRVLPPDIHKVGVFVDETFETIMQKVNDCVLTAVQLHGIEPPPLVEKLVEENLLVLKALYIDAEPSIETAAGYAADAFVVEYRRDELPGGNALSWDWRKASDFGSSRPLVLAGGLSADNVEDAIRSCRPAAVDVSSGVESIPGQKDLAKVEAFVAAVDRALRVDGAVVKKSKAVFRPS